jgi:hypothetical protein
MSLTAAMTTVKAKYQFAIREAWQETRVTHVNRAMKAASTPRRALSAISW